MRLPPPHLLVYIYVLLSEYCCVLTDVCTAFLSPARYCLFLTQPVTPFQCRLRDCTYSAPLWVNVRYTRGRQIVNKANINIGRIPVMLLRY